MIYLLGGSGYLGRAYQRFFLKKGIRFKSLRRSDIDYTNEQRLIEALRSDKPDFLINAAGYTGKPNLDACELHKGECLFGNTVLPGIIARACETVGIPWGHLSSGCIYKGSRPDGSGFTEEDPPNFTFRQNNCSFYSGCKALGEEILSSFSNVYIWRLRMAFDEKDDPQNYLSKLLRYERLLEGTNSISDLSEFVAASYACWEKRIPFGTYNVTNPGKVTTREVVRLFKKTGVSDKEFRFFSSEEEFLRLAAKAPRTSCVLDPSKLLTYGIELTELHEAILRALRNWRSQ
jgi:dTDP-4-dehydrorhamnose reductase